MRFRHGASLACFAVLVVPGLLGAGSPAKLDAWVGRFALELRVASTAKLPLVPTERSVTTTLLLVDTERAGDHLVQHHQVCDVQVDGSSAGVRTVVPTAFVEGLSDRSYPATLVPSGHGWEYRADMGFEAIGFDPRTNGGDLPTGPADPAVRDTDDDGQLGATVELRVPVVGRVRLFIAQRSHLVLSGTQTAPGRIEGEVDVRLLEQRTLGAKPGFFNRTPRIIPDPRRSTFALVRVPVDMDCTALQDGAEHLFR